MFAQFVNRISSWGTDSSQLDDETSDLLQQKRLQELPLLQAAKDNDVQRLIEILADDKCDPLQRGAMGETALHVSVNSENLEAAEVLLEAAPELVNQPMTSRRYMGQTALHIAVVNQNINLVRLLIQKGADVSSPRATGTFFALSPKNIFYFGELILSFAACVGNTDITKLLIEHGADLRAQDSWGNTVLHILVLQPNKSLSCHMYEFLLTLDNEGQLKEIPNEQGLTPLKLAATEGNVMMFKHLIQKKKKCHWGFEPASAISYDTSETDSWENEQSVLELIAYSKKQQARQILNLPPVRDLLLQKWQKNGRPYFLFFAIVYVLYMVCVSLCCANRPLKPQKHNSTNPRDITLYVQKSLKESYESYEDFLRLVGEIISVLGAITLLLVEVFQMLSAGFKHFISFKIWEHPFHMVSVSFSCAVLVTLVMRLTGAHGEVIPMSMALVLGWCYIMYFARGFQMLGPFTIMIQKMAASDLLKFFWLMAVVLCGYSTAFYVIFQTKDPDALGAFYSYPMSLLSTYQLFLNVLNGPANYTVDVPEMYSPLYASFCVIAFLLMFNLLIAMMGDTQAAMAKKKDELWRAQITGTTVMLENKIAKSFSLCSSRHKKEINLGQKPSMEERVHCAQWLGGSESDEDSDLDLLEDKETACSDCRSIKNSLHIPGSSTENIKNKGQRHSHIEEEELYHL
ncbi:transient receptor potential cation channel subfamily V member 6-like isoform X2 [Bombina bombina]|uniref:transient receptor potential cation channel subfamily V member 6-like isoform X2 n=1 Tax=Bombina bombina TaxID=8345 RepID=UPI00235A5EED|nr:transient receptor potential cation channel subfamily V member 6-like isoform X2 [Bombina bombina]